MTTGILAPVIAGLFFLSIPCINEVQYAIRCKRDERRRLKRVAECEESYAFVKSGLSQVVSVGGKQGAGKTSLIVGLTQYDTLMNQERIAEKIEWIKVIVPEADFHYLDEKIEEAYSFFHRPKAVYESCLEDVAIAGWFKGVYTDYVNKIPKPALLKTYIDAMTARERNHYVGANIKIYCPVNQAWSFAYALEDLEIKEEEVQRHYLLPKYSSIVFDESLLSIYKNTNTNSMISDTGLDLTLRIIRHLSEETVRFYLSAQSIQRMSKLIRELSTSFIQVKGYEIVGQFITKERRLRRKYEILKAKIERKDFDVPSKRKDKLNRIFQKRKKLFAASFIRYRVTVYSSLDDVGKLPEKCESEAYERDLTFPLTWVFGCYETHEFKFIDEFLSDLSNRRDIDLAVAKETYNDVEKNAKARRILEKVKSEKKEVIVSEAARKAMLEELK